MIYHIVTATNFTIHKLETGMSGIITDCFYIKVSQMAEAILFFRDVLGWKIEEEINSVLVKTDNGVHISLSERVHQHQANCIKLVVTDCLEQYCLLKDRGIIFCNEPAYSPEGLKVEFLDKDGNCFILLEPRQYND